jgi:hypothetical protein
MGKWQWDGNAAACRNGMKPSNVPFEIGASVATLAVQISGLWQDRFPDEHLDEAIQLIEEAREKIEHIEANGAKNLTE